MADPIEAALADVLSAGACDFGEVAIRAVPGGYQLSHRDDVARTDLATAKLKDASNLARFDEIGAYRPLKTAPTLRRGWLLQVGSLTELRRALDEFYPGRLDVFLAWRKGSLQPTTIRETLNRQTGMYRVAAKISDQELDDLVARFCRSDGGCLRTILWRRDASGALPSTKLPAGKFDPARGGAGPHRNPVIPLLCQEACNLLVAECREAVKGRGV